MIMDALKMLAPATAPAPNGIALITKNGVIAMAASIPTPWLIALAISSPTVCNRFLFTNSVILHTLVFLTLNPLKLYGNDQLHSCGSGYHCQFFLWLSLVYPTFRQSVGQRTRNRGNRQTTSRCARQRDDH